MSQTLWFTPDDDANRLLTDSPLAVTIGMVLDQQVPMEWAFTGPYTIARRMNATDVVAADIAETDPDAFVAIMSQKPAVHRFPGSMADRVQKLCRFLVDRYDGDVEAVWRDVDSGSELLRRIGELPGFGKQKSQVFLALLGKRFGVTPPGWREAAGPYGEADVFRSIADVTGPEALEKVRSTKKAAKQKAKE
ncbi:putative HhH-GPD family protein [Stackebrandtia endophytica]|uniref:Putative HhH-GPD family protein n=1 Tax=Stackebrandtia endophytica TaxID=1496996 RepID=A0A543APV1_9ACTN|nr:HhH-GPD-type base excision DNA repair protein [Stackebrandtia endophytica]TQL74610.1 putative HhH-GPD family protein [Stackebrandtia endophytica]